MAETTSKERYAGGWMSPTERVTLALSRQQPDRVPTWEKFWPEWVTKWRAEKGLGPEEEPHVYYGIDVRQPPYNHAPRLEPQVILEDTPHHRVYRDGWGQTLCILHEGETTPEVLAVPVHDDHDLESYCFEDPTAPSRYAPLLEYVARHRGRFAFFGDLTGPFGFYWRLCGRERTLYDVLDRPRFVRRVVETVCDFILQLARGLLASCPDLLGIVISDDIAYNHGMMVAPATYLELFLPSLQHLCAGLKSAGARFVVYHSDGDVRRAVPQLIEAGIDALHPLEVRAKMDVFEMKALYGERLAFIGNIDNAELLPLGTHEQIRAEVLHKIQAASGGGYIIGSSHSIAPDVPVENYEYFRDLCATYGVLDPVLSPKA